MTILLVVTLTVVAVAVIAMLLQIFKTINPQKEKFYTYTERKERQNLPPKMLLDAVSGNNMLTFINMPADDSFDPDYQNSMCLQRKTGDNQRACNSVYYNSPKPQTTVNPTTFGDF